MSSLLEDVRAGLLPMRCARDGRTHLVTDEEFTRGRHRGEYKALCGASVLVCSLSTGIGKRCAGCRDHAVQRRRPVVSRQREPWWRHGLPAQGRHRDGDKESDEARPTLKGTDDGDV